MQPFRIAVVGTGKMGQDHIDTINAHVRDAVVTTIVEPVGERARQVADRLGVGVQTFPSIADALSAGGFDGVLVATPGPAHEAVVLPTLEADIPILCEKPLTPDPESSLRILEAEQRLGHRRIQLGFMRRFDESYLAVKSRVDTGELGSLLMLHCAHRAPEIAPNFTTDMLITDSVVHEFDIVRFLSESEIRTVQVRRGRVSSLAHEGLADPQQVLIELDNGVLADVEINVNAQYGYQVTTEAVFEQGVVNSGAVSSYWVRHAARRYEPVPTTYVGRFGEAYAREITAWVDAARVGDIGGADAWDGYAAAVACAAGVRSQQSGLAESVELGARPSLYTRSYLTT